VFRSLINDAKSAIGALIAKYLSRAAVAIPFIMAGGFATAAVTLKLIENFGAVSAYAMVAAGFTLIGALAALVISAKESAQQDESEPKPQQADAAESSAIETGAVLAAPLSLLGPVLSALGPSTALQAARTLINNLPLVVLIAVLAVLLWPRESDETAALAGSPEMAGS
jgi:hypothetical protein